MAVDFDIDWPVVDAVMADDEDAFRQRPGMSRYCRDYRRGEGGPLNLHGQPPRRVIVRNVEPEVHLRRFFYADGEEAIVKVLDRIRP
jgi:hypothetical protein